MPRHRARPGSLALAARAALAAGCAFPEERGLARPTAVAATAFAQRDVRVGGVWLPYVDEPAAPGAPGDAPPVLILPGHTARLEDDDALVGSLDEVAARSRACASSSPGFPTASSG